MNEPLAVREAPASYQVVLEAQRVRPGYKQTEVGVIPEDWVVKPLHTLADKIMVGIASAATHAYRDQGIVLFRNQNIKSGHLDDSDVLYVTPEYEAAFKNKRLMSGDLLTARTGYPGTTCIVPSRYESAQSFTTLITRPKRHAVDSEFLCCYINSEQGQAFFEQNKIGGGQKNVNAGSLKQLLVPLPPTKAEQEAIAEALSDADALIESLEKLVTKKRHLKQGTMQELLTGKKRLPGFSGEWEVKRLGDVTEIKKGQLITEKDTVSGNIPVIAGGKKPAYFHNRANRVGKVITVSASGASAGYVAFFDEPIFASDCSTISEGQSYSIEFIYFQLQLKQEVIYKAQSGGAQPHIHAVDLMPLEIGCPSLEEQTAIATILSDMDTEIAALETRLTKTRELKQGMMHNLLTGKIRLIEGILKGAAETC